MAKDELSRVSLEMASSTKRELEKRAKKLKISLNAFIVTIAESYLRNPSALDELVKQRRRLEAELRTIDKTIAGSKSSK
jgi:hypothetical protein